MYKIKFKKPCPRFEPDKYVNSRGDAYIDSQGNRHACGGVGGGYILEDGSIGCKPVYHYHNIIDYFLTTEEIESAIANGGPVVYKEKDLTQPILLSVEIPTIVYEIKKPIRKFKELEG